MHLHGGMRPVVEDLFNTKKLALNQEQHNMRALVGEEVCLQLQQLTRGRRDFHVEAHEQPKSPSCSQSETGLRL